jgi:5-methylthioribose kinase
VGSSIVDIENPEALLRYLRGARRIGHTETPVFRTLHGGVSNKTVLLQREDGSRWVVKQALPKLRVKADWFSDPARIHVEALALQYLPRVTPPNSTPELLFEDDEHHLLAMEAVPEPNENWKGQLLSGSIDLNLVRQFGKLLGNIHGRSHEQYRALLPVFESRVFFESLRLEPYYLFTAEKIPVATRFLFNVVEENRQRRVSLVHGDYSPKNILVYQGRLVLLDHEVVHFGDPAFDLGFSLTHLLSKALHLGEHRDQFLRAAFEYWAAYEAEARLTPWIDGLQPRAVANTIACLLARTAGRSPLEYFSADECAKQQSAALSLIGDVPLTVPNLIDAFGERISS